jgi:uncharacterized protein (DUF2062 family)
MLWPRRSWKRSARYALLRIKRMDASPHALALGAAVGVFVAFQPILGFQMLLAALIAWAMRASVGAALLGTFISTPVTWPLIWLASYGLGAALLDVSRSVTMAELWLAVTSLTAAAGPRTILGEALVWAILKPVAVGAVPLGLMAAAVFYVMILGALRPRQR